MRPGTSTLIRFNRRQQEKKPGMLLSRRQSCTADRLEHANQLLVDEFLDAGTRQLAAVSGMLRCRSAQRPDARIVDHLGHLFLRDKRLVSAPGGAPASSISRSKASAHCGTFDACFTITTLPAIRLGAANRTIW